MPVFDGAAAAVGAAFVADGVDAAALGVAPPPVPPVPPVLSPFCAFSSVSWAAASAASLLVRSACNDDGSRVASVCPVATAWPTFAATAATVPAIGNATVACATGSIVPVSCNSSLTFDRVATAVR